MEGALLWLSEVSPAFHVKLTESNYTGCMGKIGCPGRVVPIKVGR